MNCAGSGAVRAPVLIDSAGAVGLFRAADMALEGVHTGDPLLSRTHEERASSALVGRSYETGAIYGRWIVLLLMKPAGFRQVSSVVFLTVRSKSLADHRFSRLQKLRKHICHIAAVLALHLGHPLLGHLVCDIGRLLIDSHTRRVYSRRHPLSVPAYIQDGTLFHELHDIRTILP